MNGIIEQIARLLADPEIFGILSAIFAVFRSLGALLGPWLLLLGL